MSGLIRDLATSIAAPRRAALSRGRPPSSRPQAFNAYCDAFFGPSWFYGPGRTMRIGIEIRP